MLTLELEEDLPEAIDLFPSKPKFVLHAIADGPVEKTKLGSRPDGFGPYIASGVPISMTVNVNYYRVYGYVDCRIELLDRAHIVGGEVYANLTGGYPDANEWPYVQATSSLTIPCRLRK